MNAATLACALSGVTSIITQEGWLWVLWRHHGCSWCWVSQDAFERLEPYASWGASTVLRGRRHRDVSLLPDKEIA